MRFRFEKVVQYFTLFALIFFYQHSIAQNIKGKVVDQNNKQSLAFVNLLFDDGKVGISTDIDGYFSLPKANIDSITFSYIGYENKRLSIEQIKGNNTIELQPKIFGIDEVVIRPGVNPAHRLIDLAIKNKKKNNPELSSEFFYESYNKMVFTCETDSIIQNKPDSMSKSDSIKQNVAEFFDEQHMFIMESVSERNHLPPDFSKEEVVASRISGLKNPMFSLLGTQLQSFSLYKNYIELFGELYLSPISSGSTSKYLFDLRDTLFAGKDTIFRIYFQPKKGKNFDGLKGFLSINTNGYAVQNFIAENVEKLEIDIKIQQKYEFIEKTQWFPVQLNTLIYFNNVELEGCDMIGVGKSYLSNIRLNSKLTKKEIGNTILKMSNEAGARSEDYWASKRKEALDRKELRTYEFIDSIGQEANLDKVFSIMPALLRGAISYKYIDFPLRHLMGINQYEGFRLGFGAETNKKFSPYVGFGAYGAYGFKDKAWKQGYHFKLTPFQEEEFEIKASYSRDITQFGGIKFNSEIINSFNPESIRRFFVNKMDSVEQTRLDISFRAFKDAQFNIFARTQNRRFTSQASFNDIENNRILDRYRVFDAGVDVRIAFREKYAEMFDTKLPLPTKYPVLYAKVTKGLDDVLDGEFEYLKLDVKLDQRIVIKNVGRTVFRIAAGIVDNPLPLGMLYRTRGTNVDGIGIASLFSFETALPNEFFTDRYFNAFVRHSFKSLLFKSKYFSPELSIVGAFAIGEMDQHSRHLQSEFDTPRHGLFESGIELNSIADWLSIGVGGYYRMGAYSFDKTSDNFVYKLTSTISF